MGLCIELTGRYIYIYIDCEEFVKFYVVKFMQAFSINRQLVLFRIPGGNTPRTGCSPSWGILLLVYYSHKYITIF